MAATSLLLSHSPFLKYPSSSPPKSHLKHQQNHLFASKTIPTSISISRSVPRQIQSIKAKATSHSDWFKITPDALKENLNKRLASLPIQQWQKNLENFNLDNFLSPLGIAKWALLASLSIFAFKLLINPYTWMYLTWYLAVWPRPTAILLGIASLAIAYRRSRNKASEWEQYIMLTGALSWLTIVPHGYVNGFIEGWPLNLFFIYSAFFFINFHLRKTINETMDAPSETETEWTKKNSVSRVLEVVFLVSMLAGHWAGAYESPVLRSGGVGGGFWVCGLIFIAMVLHYYGSYFFLKYAAGQVRPLAVVMFGPYRLIRHPIYASNMVFLVGCFLGLKAYFSLGFVFLVSLLYYRQKSNLEEDMMVETFGENYIAYRRKVKNKYLPFIY